MSKEDRELLELENMALQDELESELEALIKIEEELVKVTSMCEVASHKIQEQVRVRVNGWEQGMPLSHHHGAGALVATRHLAADILPPHSMGIVPYRLRVRGTA